jgi:hypothetical protein
MRILLTSLALIGLVGCSQSNDIPLIEFPKGAPAPPPESKEKKASQGDATSKPDPTTNPR